LSKSADQIKKFQTVESKNSTEEAFLDAAEIVFSERGYTGASMRLIADKAKCNLGALHYYFGSKEALIRKTLERRLLPCNEVCFETLEACWPDPDSGEKPDAAHVLRSYIKVFVDLSHEVNPEFDKLMIRMLYDPAPEVKNIFNELFEPHRVIFIRLLRSSHPELSDAEFNWRLVCVFGGMNFMLSQRTELESISLDQFSPSDVYQGLDELVYNLSTMFMAPSRQA
jgi:AcrR family transcriptional regulator